MGNNTKFYEPTTAQIRKKMLAIRKLREIQALRSNSTPGPQLDIRIIREPKLARMGREYR